MNQGVFLQRLLKRGRYRYSDSEFYFCRVYSFCNGRRLQVGIEVGTRIVTGTKAWRFLASQDQRHRQVAAPRLPTVLTWSGQSVRSHVRNCVAYMRPQRCGAARSWPHLNSWTVARGRKGASGGSWARSAGRIMWHGSHKDRSSSVTGSHTTAS